MPTPTLRAASTGGSAQTLTSSSFTPSANSRLLAFGVGENNNHSTAQSWTISGGSLSWSQVTQTTQVNAFGSAVWGTRCVLWTATVGGSPGSMTVTADPYSGTQAGWISLIVIEVDADDGIVQSAVAMTGYPDAGAGNNPVVTLTLAGNATSGNLVLGFYGSASDGTGTWSTPASTTQLANQSVIDANGAAFHRSDMSTATMASTKQATNVGAGGGIIVELAEISDALEVVVPALTNTATIPNPTVDPGPVSVVALALTNAATLPNPTVIGPDQPVVVPALTNTATLPDPTVDAAEAGTQDVVVPALSSAATLPNPTVVPGRITLVVPALTNAAALPNPTVAPGAVSVVVPALTNTATIPNPTVIDLSASYIDAPAIEVGVDLPAPGVAADQVVAASALVVSVVVASPTVVAPNFGWFFVTPTVHARYNPDHDPRPLDGATRAIGRWFSRHDAGVAVLQRGDEFVQRFTPTTAELEAADAYWLGGHRHPITQAQAVALTTAGYGDNVSFEEE